MKERKKCFGLCQLFCLLFQRELRTIYKLQMDGRPISQTKRFRQIVHPEFCVVHACRQHRALYLLRANGRSLRRHDTHAHTQSKPCTIARLIQETTSREHIHIGSEFADDGIVYRLHILIHSSFTLYKAPSH